MYKFLHPAVGEFAHQLTLSPRRLRVAQLGGIEKAVSLVDTKRSYPLDWVCYQVTGYQHRGAKAEVTLEGRDLVADLVTMAELLSRKAGIGLDELGPCVSQEDVAADLKVSTKTIRRWRSRGLIGLWALHEDGVPRLVFEQATIDRFKQQHETLVRKGASFKQLTARERRQIVTRAREILEQEPLRLHAVARRIAEETGRAVETVRYTLRRYDLSGKGEPLFAQDGQSLGCPRFTRIWECHQAGESSRDIARAFDCSVAEVERILRHVQVRFWQQAPPEFVYNELFDAPQAEQVILEAAEPEGEAATGRAAPRDLPAYLRSLYEVPLLTPEQEQDLFRRYNFVKFQAAEALRRLDPDAATPDDVSHVRTLLSRADGYRQRIIRANLRLVVSIAKKHVGWSGNFFEVVSDGNVSLMRAVEKFDYARGNKFSTYATWAIMKNYARSLPEEHYRAARYVTGQDELLHAAPDDQVEPAVTADEGNIKQLLQGALAQLSERERTVVTSRFALFGRKEPQTLEDIGKRFGVTKERVRQIERRALENLRELIGPTVAELLTD